MIEQININLRDYKHKLIKRNFYVMEMWLEGETILKIGEKLQLTKNRVTQLKDQSMHFLFYLLKKNYPEMHYKAFEHGSYSHYDTKSHRAKYLLSIVKSINWIDDEEAKEVKDSFDVFVKEMTWQQNKLLDEVTNRIRIINAVIDKFRGENDN